MATRNKKPRKPKRYPPAFDRHKGVVGKLYRVSGDRVIDVHGAVVGEHGFLFKERTRFGSTPRIATIVRASSLFTDPKLAAASMKTRDGWAYTYGNELVPVKVVTSDGRLSALDETGSTMHCQKVFLSTREAVAHAVKDLGGDLVRERNAYRETAKKLANLKKLRARAR